MQVALVAPPFIPVPPKNYGGTELFIAELAEGLQARGAQVVVYANGESSVGVEVRSLYETSEWPLREDIFGNLKDVNHTTWALHDAAQNADIIHLNNAPGLAASRFVRQPCVYTVHHPHHDNLSQFYSFFPDTEFVCISDSQRRLETMQRMRTIHHGINVDLYPLTTRKQDYLSFIGRIAPVKGTHLAIEVAKKTGMPLKIAGEVQPMFKDYFETVVKPHIDGKFIEYLGEADLPAKVELLGNSRAMLFPVEWEEPFGLVMIEAMACGTPVIALSRGSVPEVVKPGLSGCACKDVDAMVACLRDSTFDPQAIRTYCEERFSTSVMVEKYLTLYAEILGGTAEHPSDSGTAIPTTDSPALVLSEGAPAA
jgi:glycosyltransferase involved in cell wall biosynthesis